MRFATAKRVVPSFASNQGDGPYLAYVQPLTDIANVSAHVFTLPAMARRGDLCVVYEGTDPPSSTSSAPAGTNDLGSSGVTAIRDMCRAKVLDGSESTITYTWSGTPHGIQTLLLIRNARLAVGAGRSSGTNQSTLTLDEGYGTFTSDFNGNPNMSRQLSARQRLLVVALATRDHTDGIDTYPAGLLLHRQTKTHASSGQLSVAMAAAYLNRGDSESFGSFSGPSTEEWATTTIFVA